MDYFAQISVGIVDLFGRVRARGVMAVSESTKTTRFGSTFRWMKMENL
jgi:hypothetical protein